MYGLVAILAILLVEIDEGCRKFDTGCAFAVPESVFGREALTEVIAVVSPVTFRRIGKGKGLETPNAGDKEEDNGVALSCKFDEVGCIDDFAEDGKICLTGELSSTRIRGARGSVASAGFVGDG